MSFYDVRRISYDRLVQRVATDTPYKNSGNAYPLGDRRYSDRHFRKEDDGTFSIWYADREIVDNTYGKDNDKKALHANSEEYYSRRMIGRVHPDNSYEFLSYVGHSDGVLLSRALSAYVHNVQVKGGGVFEKSRIGGSKYIHPVFKGLRVNCDTGEAVTPYTAYLPKVKRKEANEVMKEYQEFITVFTAMINSMSDDGIWDVYTDMYKHEAGGDRDVWRKFNIATVKRLIDEKKYVDAGCVFTMLHKGAHMRWRTEWAAEHNESTPRGLSFRWKEQAIHDVNNNLRKTILRQHEDVFTFQELERGGPLPASQWGLLVTVNGEPVGRL